MAVSRRLEIRPACRSRENAMNKNFAAAFAALLAVSIGGCSQTLDPRGGPVVTSVPAAGLSVEGGCVTRNITAVDPVTGELNPIRQRFCGTERSYP